jgi:hypothetical protein
MKDLFGGEDEINIRAHSLMMRVVFSDKNFNRFVERVLKFELKFEE